MQTLSRAFQGLNLTPGERAFLKLLEGWIITAIGTGSALGYQLLMSGNADYMFIFRSAGGAALLSLILAFKKYLAAQTDLPLPEKVVAETAVDASVNQVQKLTPPSTPVPPAVPQFVQPITLPGASVAQTFNPPISLLNPGVSATNAQPTYAQLRHFGDTGLVPIPTIGQPQ